MPDAPANSGISVNIFENLSNVSANISKEGAPITIAIAPDPPENSVFPKILGLPGETLVLIGSLEAS